MSAAIDIQNVTRWFGEDHTGRPAVAHVSFEVRFGEMLYIVGPSGSGKTTLLSIISGILRPDEGRVVIAERNIWQLTPDELAELRLAHIGFVFQDFHLFPRLTTLENVAIPLILAGKTWPEALALSRPYLQVVGLNGKEELMPMKLSGGEQQRVAIARAMVLQPQILVLDEPTASLDGDTGRRIVQFIQTEFLNDQRAIVIVTHDARIEEFAHRILYMEDGQLTRIEKGKTI